MIFKSLEVMGDDTPCLEAVCVGEFETPTQLFIDCLFYRETLKPGTYSLTAEDKAYTFDLPQEGVQVTELGLPGVIWGAQIALKEG
jgi:hypothetical protein